MSSFLANIGWERPRKRENKKKLSRWIPTRPGKRNSKEIAKKFKKLENTITAFFKAKIGWRRPRKRENKKNENRSDGFLPDPEQKIPKKQQKNSKNQKTPPKLIFKPK